MLGKWMWIAPLAVVAMSLGLWADENHPPVVSNVTAHQPYDGSPAIEISYDLDDPDAGDTVFTVYVKLSRDGGETWLEDPLVCTGDVGAGVSKGTGKRITTQVPGLIGNNFKVRIIAEDTAGVRAPMVGVPGGWFKTSTNVDVYLDSYWIDTYEVTNLLYCEFLNAGGDDDRYRQSEIVRLGGPGSYIYQPALGFENRPVVSVTWYDAVAFCDWRSQAEGLPAGSYHLPTEAQWEKAGAWGPPPRTALWLFCFQSDTLDFTKCNCQNKVGHTTNVGFYIDWNSYYGCYDMTGNVWEWCSDWYGAYPSGPSNPTGPATGSSKIIRGGSWKTDGSMCGSGYGNLCYTPASSGDDRGFRCVRTCR